MTTIICLQSRLQSSGAIPPLNLCDSMAHFGTTLFYLYLLPMYIYLSRGHVLSGLIKEPSYTLLTPYMHTTLPIFFNFTQPITLTLWKISNNEPHYIILWPSDINSLCRSDIFLLTFFSSKSLKPHYSFNIRVNISHP